MVFVQQPQQDAEEGGRWLRSRAQRGCNVSCRAQHWCDRGASAGLILSAPSCLSALSYAVGQFELRYADEIVRGGGQLEPELVARPPEIAPLGASADRLDPAEDFVDPLASALTLAVAVMPTIDRAAPAAVVLGDMRGHAQADRACRSAVGAERGRPADAALQHLKRRCALGPAVGLGHVDDQTVPILGQHVTEVAELRALLFVLAVAPRLRIRRRDVRVTTAALASEVRITVATTPARRCLLVARTVALVRGPGRQQRAVDREVIGRQQPPPARRIYARSRTGHTMSGSCVGPERASVGLR